MSDRGAPRGDRGARPIATTVPGELIERLNLWWRVAGPPATQASLKQRLARPFRQMLTRVLGPQETFNSAVVQYINATSTSQHEILSSVVERTDEAVDQMERQREALAARERRLDAALGSMRAQQDELRTALGVLQQVTRQLQKERPIAAHVGIADHQPAPAGATLAAAQPPAHALSHKYVGFEDQFRGSAEDVRARLLEYVELFRGASDVLDIGCGRGEFLRLLGEAGVRARGIDVNDAMVDVCRQQGLDAAAADALAYLRAQPDESLGGLFAAQVVEHLEPAYLTQLIDAASEKLRPGAAIVLETINPACWFAFFESYIRDITHVRPLHPDTLKFLLVASGFQDVEIRYRAPYPEHEKLQPIAPVAGLADAADTLNANVEKINRLLFTHLDYAAIARRP